MTEQRPVVVGVDGSEEARTAARWAAAVAERLGVPVHVVHARPDPGHNPSDLIAAVRAATEAAADPPEVVLAAAEKAIRAEHPDLPLQTGYFPEPVDEVLVALSATAKLVVLGSDKMSVGAAVLVGSTTLTVVERARCPVVAWRGVAGSPSGAPIVVGVTADADARPALDTAFELADALGVDLVAVHSTHRSSHEDPRAVLEPLTRRYPGVSVRVVVEDDKPSRALLRHLADAQLVVVGSRGRGVLAGAVLGSTGLNLLHHSPVPTLICRPV
ncbi:universal stress protein UspA-like protein [Mycolicibacterium phlei]|jgi:nucleotide-binding universal stress UspA family protein|uniref:Universal stress protein n=1 Tax=Mycolicibacterium phlei DSM 43239 = CCUG 21000 TaxID=1226750 RepID=A0A5N5VDZ1_MYCPH|nr:universal stress protein [Mycolicibacterium phlei]VEG11229.1 universal stress protein UspA-like protein [Mycobacteroides chelonae]AMO63132.1 Universal stress protein [Mycolicibacterium phlei]KAB7759998.1 universal stress protein [Mycolicibacterium phlei DSM 43239 = CCUG 21000]KXW64369.1 hypothetical protein MPHL43072_07295 [Mycolicibacterium phlei DSM 43072]KXW69046.1 universal stress protein [Mycolicibacterium phlei DSM 43239 = CCUG 21000]